MKTFIQKFDNLHSFADYCNNAPISQLYTNKELASNTGSARFTGTENFETANRLLRDGDPAAAAKVKKEYTNIIARAKVQRPRPCPSVVGHTPIVGAYLAGDPVCMLAKKNRQTRARVITIIYNTSVHCGIGANDMAKAGANLLAAINQIEANGIRVNLYASDVTKTPDRKNENLIVAVKIKKDSQPLNLMQIAYPIANPSFLRRHIFRITEQTPGLRSDCWVRNYGRAVHGYEAKKLLEQAGVKFDAYLDFEDTNRAAPANIVTKILANIK